MKESYDLHQAFHSVWSAAMEGLKTQFTVRAEQTTLPERSLMSINVKQSLWTAPAVTFVSVGSASQILPYL